MEIKCEYDQKCDSTQICEDVIVPELKVVDVPSLEEFPGPFNFSAQIPEISIGNRCSISSYVNYSQMLNQVFISMNKMVMVSFNMNHIEGRETSLYIRAVPVYSSTDFIHEPVDRCDLHFMGDDRERKAHQGNICRCPNFNNAGHVVRAHVTGAIYSYDPLTRRHSVLVPLRKLPPGARLFSVLYSFACKTSCPKGMQRRPIKVLFTLETSEGEVLGQSPMSVKISSCPKRDKQRMERDMARDNRNSSNSEVNEDPLSSSKEELIEKLRQDLKEVQDKIKSVEKTINILAEL